MKLYPSGAVFVFPVFPKTAQIKGLAKSVARVYNKNTKL